MNTEKPNEITRYGAYGVILENSKILLTQKKSGPYMGLWGLPGGAIEFGETPEEALQREILEETALQAGPLELWKIATSNGRYDNHGKIYLFHHIGIIYKVASTSQMPNFIPQEKMRWILLSDIKEKELTPFAKGVFH
jgi:8-oxo-dGTP diphosphatase